MDINLLLRRMERGDRSAFAVLVDRFQRPLFGYLGRMGLHQGQAEEVAQETFLRAWQRIGEYDPHRAEFSTWLFTIARHLAINELKRASFLHEQAWNEHMTEACEQGQPSEKAMARQQREQVQEALRKLPYDDRSALALAYYDELDMASIARIEGCTVGAIKVRLHRAKQRLRQLLENA